MLTKKKKKIYFSASNWRENYNEKGIWSCALNGDDVREISSLGGWHSAKFNSDLSVCIDSFSSFTSPTQTKIISSDHGDCIREIPTIFSPDVEPYMNGLIKPEFIKIKTKDEFELNGMLIKPTNFDPNEKYPVLYYQYSGPHAPTMRNLWWGRMYLWHQMLAQQGYVILYCDCRTASGKGSCSTWPLFKNFGHQEMQDINEMVDWLCTQNYIDNNRIGIWGWSYGGYQTLYALTDGDRFKIGMSVAPVTDWTLYDTIYTERYMGTPQNNPDGYKASSVLNCADKLSGNLLLVHGVTDDNVHIQQSIQFIEKLQRANKQFKFMPYPNCRHGIGGAQGLHLFSMLTNHVHNNL